MREIKSQSYVTGRMGQGTYQFTKNIIKWYLNGTKTDKAPGTEIVGFRTPSSDSMGVITTILQKYTTKKCVEFYLEKDYKKGFFGKVGTILSVRETHL